MKRFSTSAKYSFATLLVVGLFVCVSLLVSEDSLIPVPGVFNQAAQSIGASPGSLQIGEVVTTTQVSQYGITWYFAAPAQVGRFANGDFWVVGPVTIANISPDFTGTRHGWQVNPVNGDRKQSFDNRVHYFEASRAPKLPYEAKPNESIVKVISNADDAGGCMAAAHKCYLNTAAVLTVLDRVPDNNGMHTFRPPYVGTSKPLYTTTQLRLNRLPSLAPVASTPSLQSVVNRFQRVQLDHVTSWTTRYMHPQQNLPLYGADIAKGLTDGALRLMLNDPIESKMPALTHYTQAGIDHIHMLMTGSSWPPDGGHFPGRKIIMVFTALMLGDQNLLSAVQNIPPHRISEDGHTYYGHNGIALFGLGDSSTASENSYWNQIEGKGDKKDRRDPYGYIDGGGTNAGWSYQHCCTSKLYKGAALAAMLLPGGKELWNHEPFFDYVDRWVYFGAWTKPDPCALQRPSPLGTCVPGSGRVPNNHGINRDQGFYGTTLIEQMWSKYRTADGMPQIRFGTAGTYNITVPIIKAIAPTETPTTPIALPENQTTDNNVIIPIISYGQSVSAGASTGQSPTISNIANPLYANYALTHNSGANALTPLTQSSFENHTSGMLEVALEQYRKSNKPMPTFYSQLSGVGGKSIQELSVRSEYIVNSVSEGVSKTPVNHFFAVNNGSNYDIYVANGTPSPILASARVARPVYYDNLLTKFRNAKAVAEASGRTFSNQVIFTWTQGQSNTSTPAPGYYYHLKQLISMLEGDLGVILGSPVTVLAMINQVNQYAYDAAFSQYRLIQQQENVFFGGPEYSRQFKYPQNVSYGVGPHLNNLGYRIMGEHMGYQLYDILSKGKSTLPYISAFTYDGDKTVLVDFSGLKGSLVVDDSLYTQTYTTAQRVPGYVENVQSYVTGKPNHLGFVLQNTSGGRMSNLLITKAEIVNGRSVQITFDRRPTTSFRIILGENLGGAIGTTIRDSVQHDLQTKTNQWGDISVHKIQHFPMVQFITVNPTQTNRQVLFQDTPKNESAEPIDTEILPLPAPSSTQLPDDIEFDSNTSQIEADILPPPSQSLTQPTINQPSVPVVVRTQTEIKALVGKGRASTTLLYRAITDLNNDGIADDTQCHIAALVDKFKTDRERFHALMTNRTQTCIRSLEQRTVAEVSQDTQYTYPLGLFDFTLETTPGATETVTLTLDQLYDTSKWVFRKYTGSTYSTISNVQYGTYNANGTLVTTVSYQIADNGPYDLDSRAGIIRDPAGPAIAVTDPAPDVQTSTDPIESAASVSDDTDSSVRSGTRSSSRVGGTAAPSTQTPLVMLEPVRKNVSFVQPHYNSTADVIALQRALNQFENAKLSETGIYDQPTVAAVRLFQNKHRRQILDIWNLQEATGFVGVTTRLKLNSLIGGQTTTCPAFVEYNGGLTGIRNSAEIGKTQVILRELDMYSGPINNTWDAATNQALIRFQETFKEVMLEPWNITTGTGYKYKTTNLFLNYFVGCELSGVYLEGVGQFSL